MNENRYVGRLCTELFLCYHPYLVFLLFAVLLSLRTSCCRAFGFVCMYIYTCMGTTSITLSSNKVIITSVYCSSLACRTAAVDNDCKRWWLTWWKTKVPITVLNFFLGFIGDSIVSMQWMPVGRQKHSQLQC